MKTVHIKLKFVKLVSRKTGYGFLNYTPVYPLKSRKNGVTAASPFDYDY